MPDYQSYVAAKILMYVLCCNRTIYSIYVVPYCTDKTKAMLQTTPQKECNN